MYIGAELTILLEFFFFVFGINSLPYFRYRPTKVFRDNDVCSITQPIGYFVFKSLISCTKECSKNNNCKRLMACNVDLNVVQCHLYYEGENCISDQPENCTCMSKAYGRVVGEAICPLGLYGDNCENTIKDCKEGKTRGLNVFTTWVRAYIKPLSSSSAFEVICDFNTGDGMTLFMARNWKCHDVNFDRNITEYIDGFGDVYGDHWLGLNRIKEILDNHPRNKLSVMLMNGDAYYYENYYSNFSLGLATDWYPIQLGQYETTDSGCGDSFTGIVDISGSSFSARGSTHTSTACATTHKGGWWYANYPWCSESLFMGPRDYMYWPSDHGIMRHSYIGMRIVPY